MLRKRGVRIAPCVAIAIGIATAVVVSSTWSVAADQAPKIGATIEDFTLIDVHDSQAVALSDFDKANVLVLMFVATQCPISNDYNERMAALFQDYKEKPVQFIGINPNKQEPFNEVLQHAKANGFDFPVLKDVDNKIADRFDARVTPEIYLLSVERNGGGPKFVLEYHGSIDDSQNVEHIEHKYLRDALEAVLAGHEVPKTETKAFGCTIKRVKADGGGFAAP